MSLGEIPPWFLRGLALTMGLLWGSFLNVVIYRVPRDMSVVHPGSHCPACGKPVAPWDNVPVLAFLWLRGRARCCGAKMSARYPLVELIGGALSIAVLEHLIAAHPDSLSAGRALAIYTAGFALSLAMVAAAFIDLEHMIIPDGITLGFTVVGVLTATLREHTIKDALLGAVVGFTAVWLPFDVIYRRVLGRTGMGLGDAKLVMLAGAWFGWQGAFFALFAGAVQGSLAALILRLSGHTLGIPEAVRAEIEELRRAAAEGDEEAASILEGDPLAEEGAEGRARMPFGPFLALSVLEMLFFGERLTASLAPLDFG